MTSDLAFPMTAFSLAAMSTRELGDRHRELLVRLREVDHWRRLVAARLDLAVAAVADLEEPTQDAGPSACPALPPDGLRDLLGIPRQADRLRETALLPVLRLARTELDAYAAAVQAVADEAGHLLATRLELGWPDEIPATALTHRA